MSRKEYLFSIFLLCWLVIGCQPSKPQGSIQPRLPKTPTIQVITPTLTYSPSTTPTVENPFLSTRCIRIQDPLNQSININGVFVVQNENGNSPSDEVYFLDVAKGDLTLINQDQQGILRGTVSPDGKWLAYYSFLWDSAKIIPGANQFTLASLDRDQRHLTQTLKQKKDPKWLDHQWLDSKHILVVISDPEDDNWVTSTVMIWNPFNGEKQIIRPDFPDLYELSPLSWGYGAVVYNPQGTRAIYLDNDYLYTLWDIEKSESIAAYDLIGYYDIPPSWSQDGTKLALVGSKGEIAIINSEGQMSRLTHLDEIYDFQNRNIYNLNWSPDGSKIAISLWTKDHDTDNTTGEHIATLAIVDTTTGKVTDTCIPVGPEYGSHNMELFWSPDGKQLVVKDESVEDYNRLILVDLERGIAAQIAEFMEPFGWMVPQN